MLKILTEPHSTLHTQCQPVTKFDSELKKLAEQMRTTMHQANGIGLAAPQVGIKQQLTVIEYLPETGVDQPTGQTAGKTAHQSNQSVKEAGAIPFLPICNPKITWSSGKTIEMTEGCLSIPNLEGEAIRPKRVKVKAQNLDGEKIIIKASGLLARVLQHEIDHLNGILFSERLKPGTELRPVVAAEAAQETEMI